MHLLIALMLTAQAQQAPPPPAEPAPVVSLERIRRGLEEPPSAVTVLSTDPTLPPIFRMDVREGPLPYEFLWQGNYASAHVRPVRGLTHHEFLEQVTPDLFRATSMYPCCPVLPVLNFLTGKLKSKDGAQSKAREEVKKALKDYQDALAAERKP